LACRRAADAARGGLWELPGGKVEPGETDQVALSREIREELGATVEVGQQVGQNVYSYAELTIRLVAYWCECSEEPVALEHETLCWVGPTESDDLDWAPADRPLMALIMSALRDSNGVGT
jgi:8-oxo-dGTP diphosphatase